MIRATELAHILLNRSLKPGDWAVDATVGNGHDALFLSELVGPAGRVFGFDVQKTALVEAAKRLEFYPQATLFHAGHELISERLPELARNRLAAVMFNLGYLPGSDKKIITSEETTIDALTQSLDYLHIGGLITLILYPGHEGGAVEAVAVQEFAKDLPPNFAVMKYERVNTKDPAPILLVIERRS